MEMLAPLISYFRKMVMMTGQCCTIKSVIAGTLVLVTGLPVGQVYANTPFFKKIIYQKKSVIPLSFSPLTVTAIHFNGFPSIDSLYCGDPLAWDIHRSITDPKTLLVKPRLQTSNTNLIVFLHNQSVYFKINIQESNRNTLYDLAIFKSKFYPKKYNHKEKNRKLGRYCYNGDEALKPLWIYDDSTFTYLKWDKHKTIPAIFRVINNKLKLSLTNYHVTKGLFRLPRVSDAWLIKRGHYKGILYKKSGGFDLKCG